MVNKLIENYINNMNISDVKKFACDNNVNLDNNELNTIYKTIKENWQTILYGNYTSIFNDLQRSLSSDTYKKIEELFFYFKNKYQRFL